MMECQIDNPLFQLVQKRGKYTLLPASVIKCTFLFAIQSASASKIVVSQLFRLS